MQTKPRRRSRVFRIQRKPRMPSEPGRIGRSLITNTGPRSGRRDFMTTPCPQADQARSRSACWGGLGIAEQRPAQNIERRAELESYAGKNRCVPGAGVGVGIGTMITDEHFPKPTIVEPRSGRGVAQAIALEAKGGRGPAIGEPLAGHDTTPPIRSTTVGPRWSRSQQNHAKAIPDDARLPVQPSRCIIGRRLRKT